MILVGLLDISLRLFCSSAKMKFLTDTTRRAQKKASVENGYAMFKIV